MVGIKPVKKAANGGLQGAFVPGDLAAELQLGLAEMAADRFPVPTKPMVLAPAVDPKESREDEYFCGGLVVTPPLPGFFQIVFHFRFLCYSDVNSSRPEDFNLQKVHGETIINLLYFSQTLL